MKNNAESGYFSFEALGMRIRMPAPSPFVVDVCALMLSTAAVAALSTVAGALLSKT